MKIRYCDMKVCRSLAHVSERVSREGFTRGTKFITLLGEW